MRKSPLTRHTPLRPSPPPARLTPLAKVGRRAKAQAAGRRRCVRAVRERVWCEWPGCGKRGEHVHEVLTRARGGSVVDPANCRFLCSAHHRQTHDRPAEAERLGLLVPSWRKGEQCA